MKIDIMIFLLIAYFAMLAAKLLVYYPHNYRPILRVPEDLAFPNGLIEGNNRFFFRAESCARSEHYVTKT